MTVGNERRENTEALSSESDFDRGAGTVLLVVCPQAVEFGFWTSGLADETGASGRSLGAALLWSNELP